MRILSLQISHSLHICVVHSIFSWGIVGIRNAMRPVNSRYGTCMCIVYLVMLIRGPFLH